MSEVDDEVEAPPPRATFRGAFGHLTDSAFALLSARAELASVELAEERSRLTMSALLGIGAAWMLSFAVLGLAAWIVVYFWDTHRLAAIAAVTAAFALAGVAMIWRTVSMWRGAPLPFSQTIAEFEKDREWLRDRPEHEPPPST